MVSNMHRLLLRKGRNNRSNSDFQTFFEEFRCRGAKRRRQLLYVLNRGINEGRGSNAQSAYRDVGGVRRNVGWGRVIFVRMWVLGWGG